MATVTAGITLTSAAGDLITDALSLSDTTTITITDMVTSGLARAKLTSTAKGTASGQATLYTANEFDATSNSVYLYIKNTATTRGHTITVYDDTSTGDPEVLKLFGGDIALLPLTDALTFKAYTSNSGTIVESMVFGTDHA